MNRSQNSNNGSVDNCEENYFAEIIKNIIKNLTLFQGDLALPERDDFNVSYVQILVDIKRKATIKIICTRRSRGLMIILAAR